MRIIFVYLIATFWLFALPASIEQFIAKSTILKKDVGIYIKEAGERGKIIASLNPRKVRTPASVVKILTIYASILKLGFGYRFLTKFYTFGSVRNGVLHGDLIVKGYGDPSLSDKDLDDIVRRIEAKGIHQITGHIVIDRSFFRVGTRNSSGFDEHPYSPYNAMPDAMMYNERVSTVCVIPRENDVRKKNVDGSYEIVNRIQMVNKPCRGRYSWPLVKIDKSESIPKVLLKGKVSTHCGKQNICKVLAKPYASFYYALKDKLQKSGVRLSGHMRLRKLPQKARLLFVHYSKPLEEIAAKTAKKSDNLYARHLLLFLGAKTYGAPATLDKGRRAVVDILRRNHALNADMLKIDNGCGLSHKAKLTAKLLVDVLDSANKKYGQRWMNILSIAGIDGTIKRRFRASVVQNRAWMKTGTLKRVKNIAGYVRSSSGQLYEVAILVNSNRGNWRASQLQNEIIAWLVKYKKESIDGIVKANRKEFFTSSKVSKYYLHTVDKSDCTQEQGA